MKEMKNNKLIAQFLAFFLFLLFNHLTFSQNIPSSSRSREAIRRVQPALEKQFADAGFQWGAPIFIRIFKESYELEIWIRDGDQFRLFKDYRISTWGPGTLGPKQRRGDCQAPEGFYFVRPAQLNPNSSFHLAFNIGYPNKYDLALGRTGNAIMVHGDNVSIGCFAMTDPIIEEIYTIVVAAFQNGQPFFRIHIFPFRMTKENMSRHRDSQWFEFWQNLQKGYQIFENARVPPNIEVKNRKYVFN